MNLSEYQRAAERTMTDMDNERRMISAALGLCGEAAEVADALRHEPTIVPECGDLLWYVAQMCKAHGKSIASVAPRTEMGWDKASALQVLWYNTGSLADTVKKRVFHQKPINPFPFFTALESIVSVVSFLLESQGHTLSDACEHNVEKLLKRFPDGFNAADANARKDEQALL